MKDYETLDLGDIKLLSGEILRSAKLAYKTYGTLNKNSDNVIVLPTFYTGTHKRNEGFFGRGRAINPNKYFIVSINMFGNGLSSSPSNSAIPQDGPRFILARIKETKVFLAEAERSTQINILLSPLICLEMDYQHPQAIV